MNIDTLPETDNWASWSVSQIIDDLMGRSFVCPECGRRHAMTTRKLVISRDIFENLGRYVASLGLSGKCLVVFDKNTYNVAGERLMAALAPFMPASHIFMQDEFHADSTAVGRLLIAMSDSPDFLVACGSGCITDTVRFAAHMTGKPFIVFGTAASMDGYASSSTPLIVDGLKTTYPSKAPVGIFADTDILSLAPIKMTAAGFGDVLAKIPSILDWKLAHDVAGEPFCPLICSLIEKAVIECLNLADDLAIAKPEACGKLMQVLALTGLAMQMMGTTRPASGGEHQISHMLEMRDIMLHKPGSLHGDKVGLATLITLEMYFRLFKGRIMPEKKEQLSSEKWESEIRRIYGPLQQTIISRNPSHPPIGDELERQAKTIEDSMESYGYDFLDKYCTRIDEFRRMIHNMGGPVNGSQLGYMQDDLRDAINFGKEVRYKYSILRIAEAFGHLENLADSLAREYR